MDRDDRRALVVGSAQEEPLLRPTPSLACEARPRSVSRSARSARAGLGLGGRQLGHLGQSGGTRLEIGPEGDLVAQLIGPAQHGLGCSRVVPQVGV